MVTLHKAGSVCSRCFYEPQRQEWKKYSSLSLILLCKHLIWYIGIYTNTHMYI